MLTNQSTSGSQSTYAGALAQNQQLYGQIMSGYQNQQNAFNQGTQNINAGYNNMLNQQNAYGRSMAVATDQAYQRQIANNAQSAISRGLGNTTVLDSMQRGANYDLANAKINNFDLLQNRKLGIQQAQLGYQGQAQQGLAGLQGQQLGFQGQLGNQSNSQSYSYAPDQYGGGGGYSGGGGGAQQGGPLTQQPSNLMDTTVGYSPYGNGLFGQFATGGYGGESGAGGRYGGGAAADYGYGGGGGE